MQDHESAIMPKEKTEVVNKFLNNEDVDTKLLNEIRSVHMQFSMFLNNLMDPNYWNHARTLTECYTLAKYGDKNAVCDCEK